MQQSGNFRHSMTVLAALVIVLAGIKMSVDLVVPFLLALFIAIICNPLVKFIVSYRVPRWLSVFMVLGMIVMCGMMLAGVVGSSLNEFTNTMPQIRAQMQQQFLDFVDSLSRFNIHIDKTQVLALFDPGMAMSVATNMLSGLGSVMTNVFMILLTTIFMLFEAPDLPRKAHFALSDPEMKLASFDRFLESVNSYLAIKTAVSLATGLAVGLLLWLLGLKFFVLFGVLAFFLNFIPNIGSIIAAVPAVLLALVQIGPGGAGAVALVYLVINIVMGNVVEPKVMGKGLGISTMVVFLSLVFWGWLLGSVGMLLSVPLTIVVKIALESSRRGRRFAYLLGDGSDLVLTTPTLISEPQADDEAEKPAT